MFTQNGLRSNLFACVEQRSKKGQQAVSPGQHPGYDDRVIATIINRMAGEVIPAR